MLNLKCDKCGQDLAQPGALLFSPPKHDQWIVEKYHLCVDCWSVIVGQVRSETQNTQVKQ